jgi:hypothetical protein
MASKRIAEVKLGREEQRPALLSRMAEHSAARESEKPIR